MIKVGDALPHLTFNLLTQEGMSNPSTSDLFANKKVVLFAVPGAFTPTCSASHLPGYITLADQFFNKGIDSIICLSVNDAFVMKAWGETQNAEHITMLADGDAAFTKALGLDKETGVFGGIRSKRYAMLVENEVVSILNIEEEKQFEQSKAEVLLTLV
ncbi:peroxiredoxin [Pseudoalteromonas denitrificans]|jgi:peroxiredoxin|uniref:Glutathione-dependent peroxiredoxin n=1 Tax=Pseudoalteromonas denitrificans DSM 6059 TaxID=1123010 RepID=A0A1I1DUY5_9GAMM|nr:peroxiredoxin [Pseudoalteromonas denitrificans]SFB78212.1 Peroxiredoxin [Pseudoalteromonas denitrificans DSM 6059]